MKGPRLPYRYDHLTWPEIREQIAKQPVVILPVGSTEDHGHHLPLDVDTFVVSAVCLAAVERIPDDSLLLPSVPYGFEDHHMDFPGTITIRDEHLLHFVLDITKSVAHHGFRKILIVNGHGSNSPILELVARRTVTETEAHCGLIMAGSEEVEKIQESELLSHADEVETSVYLHLNQNAVQMEKATCDDKMSVGRYYWRGSLKGKGASPLRMMDHWSRVSDSGVIGDATVATKEKGKRVFNAAVVQLTEVIQEFRSIPIEDRVDHHCK